MKTPHELFIGYPPDVGHIRTFGCKAHINQRKETIGKMDPRTQIGILLEYDPATKDGYLVYLPHTRQLVLSRDVVFDEAILRGQEKKPRAPPAIDLIYLQRPETLVFALKPDKYKARIVARGFEQDGNQVDDVFSPTPSYHIVRSAFALANQLNLEIHQMDINTAFLNAPLDKPVFMRCPPGYKKPGHVVRLWKALYGLKEAPRAWNITLHNQLLDRGFVRHPQEPCVYLHKDNNILLVVFVEDILIVSEQEGVTWFKQQLSSVFATKDLGEITQPQYIVKMLKRFSMENANSVDFPYASDVQLTSEMSPKTDEEKTKMKKVPYRQLVGALMFCSVTCRPDIAYVVKELARYAHEPGLEHWQAAKRVLRYLSGTKDKGIKSKAEPGKEATGDAFVNGG
ncbi:unnamed protein product [Vitrella brassicaformis CCMP3155]|uniref:Uncharacterized protein n=1 Tax=Vitrella brassicaformis (strain CCMP3155) TaxID=1169540 RepID=A0A0G4FWG3_VITBC|nr:unnamed protein product [Vitrella brassicaformis CCMP3155]|eukprot:CEM19558.1 unnamed protein product [Vitrella brassicaformis CCMP3155]